MSVLKPTSLEVSREGIMYNTMTKTFRDGSKQILCASKRIFRQPGWEPCELGALNSRGSAESAIRQDLYKATHAQEIAEQEWWNGDPYDPDNIGPYDTDSLRKFDPVELSVAQLERLEEAEATAERVARERALETLRRSIRRARVKVRDYALSTDMRYFVTFTLDESKIDRRDIHVITKKLNQWLNHQVQRSGLAYVMVPELHKDGAVHFHGLLTDALPVVDSGTIIPRGQDRPRRPKNQQQRDAWLRAGGRIVYNLPAWPYGFTTALQLDGCYEKAVNYVCKYISKYLNDNLPPDEPVPTKIGGRWYYSGGLLGTPGLEFFNSNIEDVREGFGAAAHEVEVSDLIDVSMVIIWVDADGIPRESRGRGRR